MTVHLQPTALVDVNEIIQKRDLKEKELVKTLEQKGVVDEEYGQVSIEIAKLEVKKKELSIARDKARSIINVLRVELENLKKLFLSCWKPKLSPIGSNL